MNEIWKVFEQFGDFSGLRMNYIKTTVLRIGPLWNSDAKFYTIKPLHWSNDAIKILGIWVHHPGTNANN